MRLIALLMALTLAGCGGGDYDTPSSSMSCTKVPVYITELRRECHAVGTDECAYTTMDNYTFTAVNTECKETP